MTQQPQAKYRHDYRAPDYTITDISLEFELNADTTTVTAVSNIILRGQPGAARAAASGTHQISIKPATAAANQALECRSWVNAVRVIICQMSAA